MHWTQNDLIKLPLINELMPPQIALFAAVVYMILPIIMPITAARFYKKVEALKKQSE